MFRDNIKTVDGFLSNAEHIVKLAEDEDDRFTIRKQGTTHNFETQYGSGCFKSLIDFNASRQLQNAVWEGLPYSKYQRGNFVINRYDPGDFLPRHRDSQGIYWKFQLIFLRSDSNHFIWYDEENNENVVEEKSGMLIDMPLNIDHEVTKIKENERPKYSLVLYWGL
jgi:hypothetical protein